MFENLDQIVNFMKDKGFFKCAVKDCEERAKIDNYCKKHFAEKLEKKNEHG